MFTKTKKPKDRPKIRHMEAEFALRFDMITKQEYDAILAGNMDLENRKLLNLNTKLSYMKTGVKTEVYQGRASDIQIDLMLGLEPNERK